MTTTRRPKPVVAAKPPRRRSPSTRVAPPGFSGRGYEVCLVALALGLLALLAGAEVVPVILLVALSLGVWRPRS
jgi:hypothetical protein